MPEFQDHISSEEIGVFNKSNQGNHITEPPRLETTEFMEIEHQAPAVEGSNWKEEFHMHDTISSATKGIGLVTHIMKSSEEKENPVFGVIETICVGLSFVLYI